MGAKHETPHLHVHDPSLSIKGGSQTSLDKLRLHGNTFESAFGSEQSFVQAMQELAGAVVQQ
jgi:hypothetical protein